MYNDKRYQVRRPVALYYGGARARSMCQTQCKIERSRSTPIIKPLLRFLALTVAGVDPEHLQTRQQQLVILQVLFQQIYSHIQSPVQPCFNAKLPVCRRKQARRDERSVMHLY